MRLSKSYFIIFKNQFLKLNKLKIKEELFIDLLLSILNIIFYKI